MNYKQKQLRRVLSYLVNHKEGITPKEGWYACGTMRLPARIGELKKEGYSFDERMVGITNKFGEKNHVKEYKLIESDKERAKTELARLRQEELKEKKKEIEKIA